MYLEPRDPILTSGVPFPDSTTRQTVPSSTAGEVMPESAGHRILEVADGG